MLYTLGTRTLSWFGHGCLGIAVYAWNTNGNFGLGMDARVGTYALIYTHGRKINIGPTIDSERYGNSM